MTATEERRYVPSLVGGVVSGFYVVIFMFSYASLIYSGTLVRFLPNGIGALLVGAAAVSLVTAAVSGVRGLVAAPNDNPVAISAVMAASIAASLPATTTPETTYATILVAFALTSLLCGVTFVVIGRLQLASIVRFIPYPVIGGFLAGTGLIIFRGSFVAASDVPLTLATIGDLSAAGVAVLWVPALLFGVVMVIVLMKFSHFLVVPGVVLTALIAFHGLRVAMGQSIAEAAEAGWLLQGMETGGIWQPISTAALRAANWSVIVGEAWTIGTLVLISAIAILLNATALESACGSDLDMNRELQAAGIANIIGGCAGSVAGYHYVGMTVLMRRMNACSRSVGVLIACSCIGALIFGPTFIAYIPKFLLGGLAFFIGLSFLYDWLFESLRKLSKVDVSIILTIMVSMVLWGPMQGVLIGLLATVGLFVFHYSRVSVIKHACTAVSIRSAVDRPREHRHLLHERGEQVVVFALQGFVFFGTASHLVAKVRAAAEAPRQHPLRFLLIDFRRVTGMDASALHAFVKVKQVASARGIEVVYADVDATTRRTLDSETFIDGSPLVAQCHADLDHALEYAEESLLRDIAAPAASAHPRIEEWLAHHLESSAAAAALMGKLTTVTAEAGEAVITGGEHGHALYLVEQGKLSVFLDGRLKSTARLRVIGPGSVFGAASMFRDPRHRRRLTTVVAMEPSTVHRLSVEGLECLRRENSEAALAFQDFMLAYLSERLDGSLHLVEELMGDER
jgi:SulP family sulfate permease